MVRDEADNASASLVGDLPLRNAEEADVEIVQVEFLDAPVCDQSFFVWLDQTLFLLRADTRVSVVRRVANDDENLRFLLHFAGACPLGFQFRPVFKLRILAGEIPPRKRIRLEDAGA